MVRFISRPLKSRSSLEKTTWGVDSLIVKADREKEQVN